MKQAKSQKKVYAIIKWQNRRFFDEVKKEHVTLNDLKDLVERGENLCVRDAVTRREITDDVLVSIWALCEAENPQFTAQQLVELFHLMYFGTVKGKRAPA